MAHSKELRSRISKLFPDEDFRIYIDYPFDQLVIFFVNITERYKNETGLLLIDILTLSTVVLIYG